MVIATLFDIDDIDEDAKTEHLSTFKINCQAGVLRRKTNNPLYEDYIWICGLVYIIVCPRMYF